MNDKIAKWVDECSESDIAPLIQEGMRSSFGLRLYAKIESSETFTATYPILFRVAACDFVAQALHRVEAARARAIATGTACKSGGCGDDACIFNEDRNPVRIILSSRMRAEHGLPAKEE